MAIALRHVKKKALNKKGNLKKQQSKKGNSKKQQSKKDNSKKQQSKKAGSPSYEADSIRHGIETREQIFRNSHCLWRKKTSQLSQRRALQVSVYILPSNSRWQSDRLLLTMVLTTNMDTLVTWLTSK
ncbi:hypothetical protein CRG98_049816, partial [Punica granatum]